MDAMVAIGANLRHWRVLRGLTQELVAERADITRVTLSRLEQGKGGKLSALLRVAAVLDIEDRVVSAFDPLQTDLGRARSRTIVGAQGRKRVRS
ncbi:helix-turn-helix domain-containing protein [Agrococcus casei]|uniref:helix-turn-helix domain-containing protein n=1 Tax=Agrococcus casei TaxID=343512 RepID=UPI003F93A7B3